MQIINGIGICKNFESEERCIELISNFEGNQSKHVEGYTTAGVVKDVKDCTEMTVDVPNEYNNLVMEYLTAYIGDVDYEYRNLWYYGSTWKGAKYKKYERNIGHYNHIHQEKDGYPTLKDRLYSVLLYLNTVDKGGETIFPLHDLESKPEVGKAIIWPSGFPYLHHASVPITDNKYVINAWLELNYEK